MKLEEKMILGLYSEGELSAMLTIPAVETLLDDLPLELLTAYVQARDKYISAKSKSDILYGLCTSNSLPQNTQAIFEAVKRDATIAYKMFGKLIECEAVKSNVKLIKSISQCYVYSESLHKDMTNLHTSIENADTVVF